MKSVFLVLDIPAILTPRPVILTPSDFGLQRTLKHDKISV